MDYVYQTEMVCAQEIHFHIEDDVITNIVFTGGCNGNLKAIGKLVEGMERERLIQILKGNTCGPSSTSCADQLALAVERAGESL